MIEILKKEMMMKYEMNDLAKLYHFLGIEVYQEEEGIFCKDFLIKHVGLYVKYCVLN